ncbi:MAG: lytic transglycosylase [Desulfobacterales bacterium SG8_35_2]|nr:MAG: lytic transglycosylase [Desulfobacterales bacterium SG8_35_2]
MMKIQFKLFFLIAFLIIGCESADNSNNVKAVRFDLPEIQESGVLRAITVYSATSYFIFKGRPMGFEFELLSRLSDDLGLDLVMVIAKDADELFTMLNSGHGDMVAASLTITKDRTEKVNFTEHHTITRQVLVQNKPSDWRNMKLHEIENLLIRNPIDLIGKKVHVRKGSSYYTRLLNLSDEIGGDIEIVEVPGNVTTEHLIKRVAEGEIKFTVSDENIALINQAYYPILDVKTAVSFPQRTAWVIRKNSPLLLKAVNEWLIDVKKTTDYYVIYNKYFKNRRAFRTRMESEYSSIGGGKISKFDDYIRSYADSIGWDWKLIASLIYQESQFRPKVKSWAGAVGLMQLLPSTAKHYGAKNVYNPQENVLAGTNYLKWLDTYWEEIEEPEERVKFVLASYNCGYNHIEDARRLTDKYDGDPNTWDENVADFVIKLSDEEYYNDEVVNFGYCRGEEPVAYVEEILDRYQHYAKLIE